MLYLFIRLIHMCTLLFTILTPFSNISKYIFIHIFFIPLLIIHWKTNNDTCALTELEKIITKERKNSNTFIGSIIGPVYEPKSINIQILCIVLWCISLKKIYQMYY